MSETDLWIDPFEGDPEMGVGGVLLAEDILRYVARNVVINKKDYDAGEGCGAKLKGASYAMSPHEQEAHVFVNGKMQMLSTKKDLIGRYFVVPSNHLVYVKLRQQLRIPYYMIGRHNLKIDYVYQGLLLGTGPQVDPGYVGNLIIPLHNLTTRDVKLYIDQSFVSIDFERTTRLRLKAPVPANRDELYARFGKSHHLFDTQKIDKRQHLTDYLPPLVHPQSSLNTLLREHQELLTRSMAAEEKLQDQRREIEQKVAQFERYQKIEAIAIAVAMIAISFALIAWVRDYQFDTITLINEVQDRTRDSHQSETNDRLSALEKRVEALSTPSPKPRNEQEGRLR